MYKKILVVILTVSIAPALVGILLTYSGSLIALDGTIGKYLEERAQLLSKKIEETLSGRIASFQNLTQDPTMVYILQEILHSEESHGENSLKLRSSLSELGEKYDIDECSLVISSPNGAPLVSTTNETFPSLERFSWWKIVRESSPSEAFVAEEQASEGSPSLLILAIPVIVKDASTNPDYIILCMMKLEDFLEKASFIQSEERGAPGIFSTRGRLLLNAEKENLILPILQTRHMFLKSQTSTWFPTQEINNKKHIVAFCTVKLLRNMQREGRSNCEWFSYIVFDAGDVAALINLLIWRISLLGLMLVIVLIALGLYLSSRIVKPIKQLHQGMRDITSGKLESRVEIHTGDELEDLAQGFNEMSRRLKETYDDLQNKVSELNTKANQISLIHEIAQAINSALDLDKIFTILAEEMKKIVDYEYAGIALLGENRKETQSFRIFPGSPDNPYNYTPLPLLGSLLRRILETPKPVINNDLSCEEAANEEKDLYQQGILSYIILPLLSPAGVIGVLTLGSRTRNRYGTREIDLLHHVAEALSVAVEHSRLYERVMSFAEELEEKVEERSQALEAANRKIILTEKFAASGKMAAAVAHEINNPLGIIKNYLKLFNDQWRKHSARLESLGLSLKPLEIVNDELDRIARIVRNLLDIFRPSEGKRTPTDVNKEINRLLEMMKKNLEKKGVTIHQDMEETLPHPRLSPDLLRQVLLNIIGNAEEAIPEKGEIHIQTRFLGAGTIGKKYIEIVIKDTGCGIPPENMARIFDPFFSTKKEGESTGLGLSVTYSILKTLGGDITIASDPGYGTRVRIILPYFSPEETISDEQTENKTV
ncbi:HAMP domain-containing protein [Candidatus Sumerlaeota bacterium]|nr:HAMP domain-containing protein [Candidatus Sumerlaeota bacterium]